MFSPILEHGYSHGLFRSLLNGTDCWQATYGDAQEWLYHVACYHWLVSKGWLSSAQKELQMWRREQSKLEAARNWHQKMTPDPFQHLDWQDIAPNTSKMRIE